SKSGEPQGSVGSNPTASANRQRPRAIRARNFAGAYCFAARVFYFLWAAPRSMNFMPKSIQ
ncbi:MAG: hypothetical protein KBC20_06975, partial [Oscillospiraceae bacterium]|nr:hypothetical protein [Oscillospiraceae bacterium]